MECGRLEDLQHPDGVRPPGRSAAPGWSAAAWKICSTRMECGRLEDLQHPDGVRPPKNSLDALAR